MTEADNTSGRKIITRAQAIKDLREIFDIPEKWTPAAMVRSYETEGRFGIHKQVMGRYVVISKVLSYFADKQFKTDNMGCIIGSITLLYTTFEIRLLSKAELATRADQHEKSEKIKADNYTE